MAETRHGRGATLIAPKVQSKDHEEQAKGQMSDQMPQRNLGTMGRPKVAGQRGTTRGKTKELQLGNKTE